MHSNRNMKYINLWLTAWAGFARIAAAASIPNNDNDVGSDGSKVPYTEGLTLGQGYNTYLQQGCLNGAVDVNGDPSQSPQVQITYQADQITEYSKIAQELDISASLGISFLDNSAEVQSKFLNKATFEESLLTYIVRADVVRQPSSQYKYEFKWDKATNPQKRYCDRFISDFVEGGALYARVSIKSKDSSKNQDLEMNAKTAFGMFGVDVTVDAAMKKSSEFLQQNSEVHVSWFWVGAPPSYSEQLKSVNEVDGNLLEIKNLADKFIKEAGQHQWKRYAILERYDQVFNWNNEFVPLDYTEASERTWGVFNDYASYDSMLQMVQKLELPDALKERSKKLQSKVIQTKFIVQKWINNVTANPDASKQNPQYKDPDRFYATILNTLSTRFIAQKVDYPFKDVASSSLIDSRLHTEEVKATPLFQIQAFTFPGITGTRKLTFGNRPKSPWWTTSFDAPLPSEFVEQSHLWVLSKPREGGFDQSVYIWEVYDSVNEWWDRLEITLNSKAPDAHVRGPSIFYAKLARG